MWDTCVMRLIHINDMPKCATCGTAITHSEKWQQMGPSLIRSGKTAPNPNSRVYQNQVKEGESILRTGGWRHKSKDVSHDPGPHDGRSTEEERDRYNRWFDVQPDHIKRIVNGLKEQIAASVAAAATRKESTAPAAKPTTQDFINDMTDEELEKWNKNAPEHKKAVRTNGNLSTQMDQDKKQ